jgi:hypothetical protein
MVVTTSRTATKSAVSAKRPATKAKPGAAKTRVKAAARPASKAAAKPAVAKPVAAKRAPAKPTATKPTATKPTRPSAPRRARPLIALVRKSDGRALSYSERLGERMHANLKHAGPVCHRCRMNASRLASIAAGASPIAI